MGSSNGVLEVAEVPRSRQRQAASATPPQRRATSVAALGVVLVLVLVGGLRTEIPWGRLLNSPSHLGWAGLVGGGVGSLSGGEALLQAEDPPVEEEPPPSYGSASATNASAAGGTTAQASSAVTPSWGYRALQCSANTARPTGCALGRNFSIAVYEDQLWHTETMGVFLDYAYRRGYTVTLYVEDSTSYRSFIPLYKKLYGGSFAVRSPQEWPQNALSYNVTVFNSGIPRRPRGLPLFPAPVHAMQLAHPDRMVYVIHHVDVPQDGLRRGQSRIISLTPLLSSPYLTPTFRQADYLHGPRLSLSQRSRTLCMIGSGASGNSSRYNTSDVGRFMSLQRRHYHHPGSASQQVPSAPFLADPARCYGARGGAAAPKPAGGGGNMTVGAAALEPFAMHRGAVWHLPTLRWLRPEEFIRNGARRSGLSPGAGASGGGGKTAAEADGLPSLVTSTVHPFRAHVLAREGPEGSQLLSFLRKNSNIRRLRTPAILESAARGMDPRHGIKGVRAWLGLPPVRNDPVPVDSVTARFINFDTLRAFSEMRKCAFVVIHPLRTAREVVSRMTGSLPTALMARTPLIAPRFFTDIYGLSNASLAFESSMLELAQGLATMSDGEYEGLLDGFDAARERVEARSDSLLDRIFSDPSFTGVDAFGPGWDARLASGGGLLPSLNQWRRTRGLPAVPPPVED